MPVFGADQLEEPVDVEHFLIFSLDVFVADYVRDQT